MTPATEPALPPLSQKEVRITNAYDQAGIGNANLLPLFPYWGPGDIVPCTAAHGGDGTPRSIGYFVHTNTVDELVLNLAAGGQFRTGELYVGNRRHGVGGATGGQPFFAVQVICQRQLEEGEQPESLAFECSQCNAEIFKLEFGTGGYEERVAPLLPTCAGTLEAMQTFNSSEELRLCKACGHQNEEFPIAIWGYPSHYRTMHIADAGRKAIREVEAARRAAQ